MPAIIFDFDGVLVDSEPVHEAAIRAAMAGLGMRFTAEDYRTRYLGLDDRDIYAAVARAHGRTLSEPELAGLRERKWAHVRESFAAGRAAPFPGAVQLFRAASAACSVAICSGARREEIDFVLARLELRGLARVIVSADEVARSKPDPESYLLATRRLGVPARECVAIEDTDKGVAAARGAGVRVVGVCHSMTAPELGAADRLVESVLELSVGQLLAMVRPEG
jgi:HAD superfamily hydrolase (TIGR01509 family)